MRLHSVRSLTPVNCAASATLCHVNDSSVVLVVLVVLMATVSAQCPTEHDRVHGVVQSGPWQTLVADPVAYLERDRLEHERLRRVEVQCLRRLAVQTVGDLSDRA